MALLLPKHLQVMSSSPLCPSLDQIAAEPLPEIYWTPSADLITQWKTEPVTPPPPTESHTYTPLEPCLPDSGYPLPRMDDPWYSSFFTPDPVPPLAPDWRTLARDEGIGSSPSISPPGSVQMDIGYAAGTPGTNDSGFMTANEDDLSSHCFKCGLLCPSGWFQDSGGNFLCRPCHLYSVRSEKSSLMKPKKEKTSSCTDDRECHNCKTKTTSLWRRDARGHFNCNACGLYEKMNKCSRPITMRKDTIKRRQRKMKGKDSKRKKTSDEEEKSPNVDDYSEASTYTQHLMNTHLQPPIQRESVLYYAYDADHQLPVQLPHFIDIKNSTESYDTVQTYSPNMQQQDSDDSNSYTIPAADTSLSASSLLYNILVTSAPSRCPSSVSS